MDLLITCILFIYLAISTATSSTLDNPLVTLLSPQATISGPNSAPRWSEFDSPAPLAVVNVATERDVLLTVRYDDRFHGRDSAC
jgi:hypothetical protein